MNDDPIWFLSFINVLNALSRRSCSPLLISPDGVNRNPRYLYERTFSNSTPLKWNLFLNSLPVLLKIMHLVLSVFIISLFSSQYVSTVLSISAKPFSLSANNIISSAEINEPISVESNLSFSWFNSSFFGRSDMNILNKRGLRTHPCLTPWLTLKYSLIDLQF